MTEYDVLAEVYEWLISDAKLPPAEFAASFDDVLNLLPSNAHVLDCSCGTGQLAVGLDGLGVQVVATDFACWRPAAVSAPAVRWCSDP